MLPGLSERKVVMGTRRQQVPEAGISSEGVCHHDTKECES